MYYRSITNLTQGSIYETAIGLTTPLPIEAMREKFPAVIGISIHFKERIQDFDYETYLENLCQVFELEGFCFESPFIKTLPASLWKTGLKQLSVKLASNQKLIWNMPQKFDNHLYRLWINTGKSKIPAALFQTSTLQEITLIQYKQSFTLLNGASELKVLNILSAPHTMLDLEAHHFPHLHDLHISSCDELCILPNWNDYQNLVKLHLWSLPKLNDLSNNWDALQQLDTLYVQDLKNNLNCKNLYFNELSKLRILNMDPQPTDSSVTGMPIAPEERFLGKMPALTDITLSNLPFAQLPDTLFESQLLNYCRLSRMEHLKSVPMTLTQNPNLSKCLIYECPKLRLHPKVLQMPALTELHYDFSIDGSKLEHRLKYHLMEILQKQQATFTQRRGLGSLLFEPFKQMDWDTFKLDFFEMLSIADPDIKGLVRKYIYLLNPNQAILAIPTDCKGKSITLLGATHKPKTAYRQKLKDLGMIYHAPPQAQTDWIVVANAGALPSDFWAYPHLFFTEQDLEQFVSEQRPDFLQTEDAPDWQSLRQLLYSKDGANDELVMEMIRSGGIPKQILPDLVLVAKSSPDETLRAALRKLIKPHLTPDVFAIFTNKGKLQQHFMFDIYAMLAPNLDVIQMWRCYYERTGTYFEEFFRLKPDSEHPYRLEMLEIWCHEQEQRKIRQFKWDWRFPFNEAETTFILERPYFQQNLINFTHSRLFENIPKIIFKCKALESLTLTLNSESLSDEITELTKLTHLELINDRLKTLPEALFKMPALRHLTLYLKEGKLVLPQSFKVLAKKLKDFKVYGTLEYGD